jgi:hypothetical protein
VKNRFQNLPFKFNLQRYIKVLGTPTREEIHAMNPNYTEFKFPQIKAHPWSKVFHKKLSPEALDLISHLLVGFTLFTTFIGSKKCMPDL